MLWPMKANNLKRKISRRWLSSPCILEWLISGAFCELKFFKFFTKCQNILRRSFAIMRQVLQFSPPFVTRTPSRIFSNWSWPHLVTLWLQVYNHAWWFEFYFKPYHLCKFQFDWRIIYIRHQICLICLISIWYEINKIPTLYV